MSIIIGILYVILVVTCLVLGLLILVQLPKKDAGAGMAFGGGAGEALFGAGSGNVLTKLTRYSAIAFLGLSLLLSVFLSNAVSEKNSAIDDGLAAEDGAVVEVIAAEPTPTSPLDGIVPLDVSGDSGTMADQVSEMLQKATQEVPATVPVEAEGAPAVESGSVPEQ